MKKFIAFFIKYPFWSNVIILLTVLGGGYLLYTTKRSYFPERKVKEVYIEVSYLGASPEEMEESITEKIEDNLRGIENIDEIQSSSSENFAQIQVIGTNRVDIDELLTDVKNAVDQINSFPSGAEKPKVYKKKPKDPCIYLTLSGGNNLIESKDVAENIYDDFLATGFISQIVVSGVGEPEMSVEIKERELEKYGITLEQVQQKLSSFNRDVTLGSIKSVQQEYYLRFKSKTIEIEKIRKIPILTDKGSEITLEKIAEIKYQLPPDQQIAKFNGKQCVNINLLKTPDEDILQIADYAKEYVEEFNSKNSMYKLVVLFDASEAVRDRINILLSNGFTGLILVVLVLGFFMNFKLSFWVGFGIPMSFLGMFFLVQGTGLTINQISLFGMILVSGILVDDGIVISENIYSKIRAGIPSRQAALEGSAEMLPAVFSSVLTTVLVFGGFFFVEGSVGEIIPEMGIVVIACLSFSLMEATFLLPAHLNIPSLAKKPGRVRQKLDDSIDFFRFNIYGGYLDWALKWKWVTLSVGIGLIMIGMAFFKSDYVGKSFFPSIDSDLINIEIASYPGQSSLITEKELQEIEKKVLAFSSVLEKSKEGTPILFTRYSVGANSLGLGNHAGTLEVRLKRAEERSMDNAELSKRLRDLLKLSETIPLSAIGGKENFGKPISYKLVSKNKDQLIQAKDFFKQKLSSFSQVADITDNSLSSSKEIVLNLTDKAIDLGFTPQEILTQLRARFFGIEVQKLTKNSREMRLWVRLEESERNSVQSLSNLKIRKNNQSISLSELANWSYANGNSVIKHYNGMREVSIEASNANPSLPIGPVVDEIETQIIPQLTERFSDVKLDTGGQAKSQNKLKLSAIPVTIIVLILIYCIIGLTFRSWLQPLLVLLLVLPTLLGAALGHWVENTFVVIMSYLGGIALLGILVNDAIVFIDRFNENIRKGFSLNDSLIEAGTARFRPIIMTSITTMAGLYPLIFEGSNQAKFLIPMAITLTYGVLFSTLYTLLFLPQLVACANEGRRLIYWIWNGKWVDGNFVEPASKERRRLMEEGYVEEELD